MWALSPEDFLWAMHLKGPLQISCKSTYSSKLGFNQNYFMFALKFLVKIDL